MRRRVLAGAGAAALGAATAVAALVIGTTTGYAETTTSSAYGLGAEGAIPIPPTPYVESTDGSDQTSTELEIPPNPLIALEAATVSAGAGTASVELLNFGLLPGAELPPELAPLQDGLDQLADALAPLCDAGNPIDQIPPNPITDALPKDVTDQLDPQKLCDVLEGDFPALLELDLVKVFCEGTSGGVEVGTLTLLGTAIEIPSTDPNTQPIPENPLLNITINKQVTNEDGSFSVSGVEIDLGDGQEVITLGNATCGGVADTSTPPTAKPPTPVTTGLPVTG